MDYHVFKGCHNVFIKFSRDASLFAYFTKEKNEIHILRVEKGIGNLLRQISMKENKGDRLEECHFNGETSDDEQRETIDMSFINRIDFDYSNRFLLGIGDTKVLILNIKECTS